MEETNEVSNNKPETVSKKNNVKYSKEPQSDILQKFPFLGSMWTRRIGAAAIDLSIAAAICFVLSLLALVFSHALSDIVSIIAFSLAGVGMLFRDVFSCMACFYYKTPGRAAMEIKVTSENGKSLSWQSSFKRNLPLATALFIPAIQKIIELTADTSLQYVVLLLGMIPMIWLAFEAFRLYKSPECRRPVDIKVGALVSMD